MNTKLEIFEQLVLSTMFDFARPKGRYGKPGALVERLSAEKRAILQGLTVADLDKCFHPYQVDNRKPDIVRDAKMQFDKLLLRR